MKKAETLDPFFLIINADLAELLLIAHFSDQSIQQSRKTIEMDPGFAMAHNQLAQASLRISQIDRPHRARRQAKLPRHPSYRGVLTGLSHRFLKALAEGRLARQQRYFLRLDSALRTAHPIELDHHRRPVF
jgi:hypothetical protein